MHEAGKHFLAGAALAGDEHRGFRRRDLLGKLHDRGHRLVAIDHVAVVLRHGGKDGGDQIGIGRQRDVFFGAGMNGAHRGAGVIGDAAGHDRHMNALGFQLLHQFANVDGDIDHHEIGAAPGAQHGESLIDGVGVGDRGALVHRDLAGDGKLAAEGADDE